MTSRLLKQAYNRIFPGYETALDKAVGSSKTLLDVGCGYPSPIKGFSARLFSVGADIYGPSIEKSRSENIHNDYATIDVLNIDSKFAPGSFECVLASDLIEHLTKEDGAKLLEKMEAIASKKIIIFTPNGFLAQPGHDGNPWQEHKSGWSAQEMQALGYQVWGINGWKPLRGQFSYLKYRPKQFWRLISDLTQLFTKSHPKYAFQILCVKEK